MIIAISARYTKITHTAQRSIDIDEASTEKHITLQHLSAQHFPIVEKPFGFANLCDQHRVLYDTKRPRDDI